MGNPYRSYRLTVRCGLLLKRAELVDQLNTPGRGQGQGREQGSGQGHWQDHSQGHGQHHWQGQGQDQGQDQGQGGGRRSGLYFDKRAELAFVCSGDVQASRDGLTATVPMGKPYCSCRP